MHKLFTSYPMNIGSFDATSGPEGCAVYLAAHAAMTKQHVSNGAMNFEGNAPA